MTEKKARERREQTIEKAELALKSAQETHNMRVSEFGKEQAALDRRTRKEKERWLIETERLEAAIRKAKA